MRLSPWGRVVAISALLVVGGVVALAIGGAGQPRAAARLLPGHRRARGPRVRPRRRRHHDRRRRPARRRRGPAHRALRVRAHAGDRTRSVEGRRLQGHLALPDLAAGPVHASSTASSCPTTSRSRSARRAGTSRCAAIAARRRVSTTSGSIDIGGYCGNALDARAGAGDITLDAICAPPQADAARRVGLRPRDAARRAATTSTPRAASGDARVRGITPATTRRTRVQVLSGSGDVDVEGRS